MSENRQGGWRLSAQNAPQQRLAASQEALVFEGDGGAAGKGEEKAGNFGAGQSAAGVAPVHQHQGAEGIAVGRAQGDAEHVLVRAVGGGRR